MFPHCIHFYLSLQPTWQSILTEPDGLDYTSSEGEEEMMATQEGLRSSMLSPQQGTPKSVNTLLGSPGSPMMPSMNGKRDLNKEHKTYLVQLSRLTCVFVNK